MFWDTFFFPNIFKHIYMLIDLYRFEWVGAELVSLLAQYRCFGSIFFNFLFYGLDFILFVFKLIIIHLSLTISKKNKN